MEGVLRDDEDDGDGMDGELLEDEDDDEDGVEGIEL